MLAQGEMAAMFLRHEGFLGAMGAFLKVHPMTPSGRASNGASQPQKVRWGGVLIRAWVWQGTGAQVP